MKRIAIFGGTFNPVHKGHIHLCSECQRIYNFDKILLIPTNIPPHKNALGLASNADRYNMLKLSVDGIPYFEVSDIEFKLGEKSYTINTVLELEKQYPVADFYLIIGSDMLRMFTKWACYKDILEQVTLVVGARHEAEFEELIGIKNKLLSLSNKVDIINISVLDISSTQIRENQSNNESISEFVSLSVESYIQKNHLYSDS